MPKRFAVLTLVSCLPLAACPVVTPGPGVQLACSTDADCPAGTGNPYCVAGHCASSPDGGPGGSGGSGTGATGSSRGEIGSGSGTASGGSSGSSGATSANGSSGTSRSGTTVSGSSGSSSLGGTTTSGGSSGGTSTGSTSSSGGIGSGGSSGGPCIPGYTPARVLATGQAQNGSNEVWDVSNPANAFIAASWTDPNGGLDHLAAVAIAGDGEILALSHSSGLLVYDSCGKPLGTVLLVLQGQSTAWTPGAGYGLAYVPQPEGGVIVVCDWFDGVAGFAYRGAAALDGGYLSALWPTISPGNYWQCLSGSGNTFYAVNDQGLFAFDATTGQAGVSSITPTGLTAYGGAIDPIGNLLAAGQDTNATTGAGAAELYNSALVATHAVTGALNCSDLTDCVSGGCVCQANSSLTAAVGQAASLPDGGGFVAAYSDYASSGSTPSYNVLLQLTPSSGGFTVKPYYTALDNSLIFYGLVSTP
ncbi:MAG: hypothetical protein ACYDCL_05675 [Myxococcales bacterium]